MVGVIQEWLPLSVEDVSDRYKLGKTNTNCYYYRFQG